MEKRLIEISNNLCNIIAPSGYEDNAVSYIEKYMKENSVFSIKKDKIGNIICSYCGRNPNKETCFIAHIDSAGIFCSFSKNGNSGTWGSLSNWKKEKIDGKIFKFLSGAEMIVDYDKKQLFSSNSIPIKQGDFGAFKPSFSIDRFNINGTFLDNRIICACLLYFAEMIIESEKSFSFIFTVQEEIGNKGAKAITHCFEFDKAYILDTTACTLEKGSALPFLGNGACIKICDGSGICSRYLNNNLSDIAKRNNITIQNEILDFAGSDIGAFSEHGFDCYFTGISIPCYNMHSSDEMMSVYDVDCFCRLLKKLLEEYYGAKFKN